MSILLDRPWTVDTFLAWEDRQEFRHEFDGRGVIPMTGGSLAHQRIVLNLCFALMRLVGTPLQAAQEMRMRIGSKIRYPDVVIFQGPLDQATRTLTDAVAVFEVISDETAEIDRTDKLADYALIPSLRYYVILEQTAPAATIHRLEAGRAWTAAERTESGIALDALGVIVPLSDVYQGLTFGG